MPYRPGVAGWIRCARASMSSAPPACGDGGAGERGGGVAVEVGTGVQAKQPERAGGAGVQVPVGPGEHGPDRGARDPRRRRAGPAACAGRPARRPGRPAGRPGGRRRVRRRPAAPAAAGSTGRPASAAAPGVRRPPGRRSAPAAGLTASASGSRSRSRRAAPSRATSPASASRLVTSTAQPGVPGSSGRTCSTDRGVVQHDQHPLAGQQAAVPGGALVLPRPGCPGRARRGRAGTRPARRRPAPAGRGRSRAG